MLLRAPREALPEDYATALLVGRVYDPEEDGPSVVVIRGDELVDITNTAATLADLLAEPNPVAVAGEAPARKSWPLDEVLTTSLSSPTPPGSATPPGTATPKPPEAGPVLLAPCDLQVLKAAGVTFASSMMERVVEELAGGDPAKATTVRADLEKAIGGVLSAVVPGSLEAATAKEILVRDGLWSPYLEVGLGPDPEVFTKAPVLSAVGLGADLGVAAVSSWNNSEPEVVLAVRSDGTIVGATLGNDVNLRDIEGRSALLLPKAKDNNASAAVGPFLRLFDDGFDLDDVRNAEVRLEVTGADGFTMTGTSSMSEISRDPLDLVAATIGAHHQYPDGFLLYTGTLFSPTEDRGAPGAGFTHYLGDVVRIESPRLGTLVNTVNHAEAAPPWTFGIRALIANLARRGL